MGIQQEQLERVESNIAWAIIEFMQKPAGTTFRAEELRDFVRERALCAPASPDRVLRDLRKRRKLNYRVVNRSESLYEVLAVC